MKKVILISAVLLMGTVSFAQSQVQCEAKIKSAQSYISQINTGAIDEKAFMASSLEAISSCIYPKSKSDARLKSVLATTCDKKSDQKSGYFTGLCYLKAAELVHFMNY